MSSAQLEIQIIACLVAVTCAIPGTFLVLRKMAMISDAISHSILPGIVLGFLITEDINSPLLILLATLSAIITVFLVEYIQKTGLVKEDTAIGLVFPSLFSIGIILISKNTKDIHLDVDAVLLGELAFAPFNRILINDVDYGPKSIWIIGSILMLTLILLFSFFKELKITTFDAGLSASLGISPVIIHYGLMSVSSITTVGAFDAVGAILVVAFIIAPPATAYLITNHLKKMISLAALFGIIASISGYWLAHYLDASIAGSITSVLGIIFLFVYFFSPKKGLIYMFYKERRQRNEVSLLTFLLHIKNHSEASERHVKHLNEHINWQKVKSQTVLELALKNNLILIDNNIVSLTKKGDTFTSKAIDFIISNEKGQIEDMKADFFLFRG